MCSNNHSKESSQRNGNCYQTIDKQTSVMNLILLI